MATALDVRIPLGVLAPSEGLLQRDAAHPVEHDLDVMDAAFRSQRIAVCDESGLLAVANGRVIDLFHADAMELLAPERQAPVSTTRQAHLPFAGQIVLNDHLQAYTEDEVSISATCVAFVAPGFLLVTCSQWLCGFRIYARTVAVAQPYAPSSLFVHCAFVDRVPSPHAVSSLSQVSSKSFSTRDAGVVVLLFRDQSCFGVFQWIERFSDRVVSIARLSPTANAPLTALAVSEDTRWMAFADTSGAVSVVDCDRFAWELNGHVEIHSLDSVSGKRLALDTSVRMGRVAQRDHPLDAMRLVAQVRSGAVGSFGTCLRWWKPSASYLLVGQNDGALAVMMLKKEQNKYGDHGVGLKIVEIYPALRSQKRDAVWVMSEPQYCETKQQFSLTAITQTSWRFWTVGVMPREDATKRRLQWPTLKDSLGVPTVEVQDQSSYCSQLLSPSSTIASRLTEAFTSHPPPLTWLLVLKRDAIHARAYLIKEPVSKTDIDVQQPEARPTATSITQKGEQEVQTAEFTASTPTPTPVPATQSETLQDRYKIPPMRESTDEAVDAFETSTVSSASQRITKDEYNARLAAMAHRVDRLSTSLHALRTSFHLFTDDVQRHMTWVSDQLEELHTQQSKA